MNNESLNWTKTQMRENFEVVGRKVWAAVCNRRLSSFSSPSWKAGCFSMLFCDHHVISKMTFSRISLPGSYMELTGALCMTFPQAEITRGFGFDNFLPASHRPFLSLFTFTIIYSIWHYTKWLQYIKTSPIIQNIFL